MSRASKFWAGVLLALLSLPPANASADAFDDEIDARIEFLEARIEAQRTHAELWWKGWLTFYAFGAAVQAVRAADATIAADQADLWISFAKSTGAFARFALYPYAGIRGLDPAPGYAATPEMRLDRAERIMLSNAEHTNAFGPWYAHLINAGINGGGAVIVGAGFDDWRQGIVSALIGFGVGEVVILTAPWEADSDLADYNAGGWRVQSEGSALVVRF